MSLIRASLLVREKRVGSTRGLDRMKDFNVSR